MPRSLAQVWLHVIFSTKERRPFFQNSEFREEMFRMLAHHVKEAKCVSDSVDTYIRNQEQHHAKLSFQEEYRIICQKHEIEIDERYVWD